MTFHVKQNMNLLLLLNMFCTLKDIDAMKYASFKLEIN